MIIQFTRLPKFLAILGIIFFLPIILNYFTNASENKLILFFFLFFEYLQYFKFFFVSNFQSVCQKYHLAIQTRDFFYEILRDNPLYIYIFFLHLFILLLLFLSSRPFFDKIIRYTKKTSKIIARTIKIFYPLYIVIHI